MKSLGIDKVNAKSVLITGAGRGIGAACAEVFFRDGYNVIMASRTESEIAAVAQKIGRATTGERLVALAGDVSDPMFVRGIFAKAKVEFGSIDVLVNNAGILVTGKFKDLSLADWDQTIRVNLTGAFLCSQEFFRQASPDPARRKVIVNLGSLGGIQNSLKFPDMSAYVVSKFGMTGLTEALAVEGRALGIDVIGIAPGAVDTDLFRRSSPDLKAGAVPLDIAEIIFDLANRKSFATFSGSMIPLDTNL